MSDYKPEFPEITGDGVYVSADGKATIRIQTISDEELVQVLKANEESGTMIVIEGDETPDEIEAKITQAFENASGDRTNARLYQKMHPDE